ncbi:uncharacterized protein SAPINGB_P002585 [Magnusiomyces paraingens]|uniref:Uncharacterized protein n=1 Tax=Magnusiomyces paraingens TaxID=2606893 RepID=A0A5E8BEX5_9ASCO|nr:uncharacterized protein SAPINGB_P002585 [Saprochaete ingens]VVT50069.1 unnamed protein product [Saprochaete ingens]
MFKLLLRFSRPRNTFLNTVGTITGLGITLCIRTRFSGYQYTPYCLCDPCKVHDRSPEPIRHPHYALHLLHSLRDGQIRKCVDVLGQPEYFTFTNSVP